LSVVVEPPLTPRHSSTSLTGSLRLELIQLSLLPVDFGARVNPPLRLHPFAGPASDRRLTRRRLTAACTGASAGVTGRAADDRAQAGATQCPNGGAFLSSSQRFGTTEKHHGQ
jgi:hypothetical protein